MSPVFQEQTNGSRITDEVCINNLLNFGDNSINNERLQPEDGYNHWLNMTPLDSPLTSSPASSRPPSPLMYSSFDATLVEKIKARIESKDKFFSLEFFPPRTKSGAVNLLNRVDRMRGGNPLFIDITWHPAGNPAGDDDTSSMMIAHSSVEYLGVESMLHMTCVGLSKDNITEYLRKSKKL
jgi:hypothetical protein